MWDLVKARASPTRSPDRAAVAGLLASLPRKASALIRVIWTRSVSPAAPCGPLRPGQEAEFDEGADPEAADGLARLNVFDALDLYARAHDCSFRPGAKPAPG